MPERFSTEKYLSKKGKEYHSVTKWSYKIIYRIMDKEVRILAIIHTKRNSSVIENIS
ncbi:type II toxin-antitoxin system RelE/ParE family toxin [Pedobacter cryophilus]|uniref:Type II toxin-antitoxin system RelE/ParE family toxin n=1 Tax=Pedobacter cryophilus TaxID=2571271 RepID=A0A4U1C400_9SPHI|nr:type II toxin-antitoxin system RelE/ParE family toxin [Pedobacter cryophilus]TKB98849.1 type II toxin-antitoxin system RelE/ParE family toxin [Pedobacter cryophilus]